MARRIRDPQARARIVEVAWRVVAERGIAGATVRAIAAEAGVSTGFVTHYFADKRELIGEVLRHNNARAERRVTPAIEQQRGLAALAAAAEALLPLDAGRRREWQVWVAAWAGASRGDALASGLTDGWSWCRRLLATLLEQAIADGELPGELDVDFEAERVLTLIAGCGLIAGVESSGRVRRTAKRMLSEQLAALGGAAATTTTKGATRA